MIKWFKKPEDVLEKVAQVEDHHALNKAKRVYNETQTEHHTKLAMAGKYNSRYIAPGTITTIVVSVVVVVVALSIAYAGLKGSVWATIQSQTVTTPEPEVVFEAPPETLPTVEYVPVEGSPDLYKKVVSAPTLEVMPTPAQNYLVMVVMSEGQTTPNNGFMWVDNLNRYHEVSRQKCTVWDIPRFEIPLDVTFAFVLFEGSGEPDRATFEGSIITFKLCMNMGVDYSLWVND